MNNLFTDQVLLVNSFSFAVSVDLRVVVSRDWSVVGTVSTRRRGGRKGRVDGTRGTG